MFDIEPFDYCVRQNTLGTALDMVSRVITTRGCAGRQLVSLSAPPLPPRRWRCFVRPLGHTFIFNLTFLE